MPEKQATPAASSKSRGSCLIVGAGIAGLMAAKSLLDAGYQVKVLETASVVGGRMAVRRLDGGVFDHGAQFVSARDPRFQAYIDGWQRKGIVQQWAEGFPTNHDRQPTGRHPRYRTCPDMTAIPRALAEGVDVELDMQIESVTIEGGRWLAVSDNARSYEGDAIILSPPVPLSLRLLRSGGVGLPHDIESDLGQIDYHPCLALMLILETPSAIPAPGAMQFDHGFIRWMADNQQKGISPQQPAITIHAAPQFSRENWEETDEEILERLLMAAAPWIPAILKTYRIHRWRYSQPVDLSRSTNVIVPGAVPVLFAGDAFAGGRVEGAALSGLKAAEWLIDNT